MRRKNKEFACQHCGMCCGVVPVTIRELGRIKRAIKNMETLERERLKNQKRRGDTCPLRDVENKRCSVWESRPEICQMQGFYVGLNCPNNPSHATGSREEGRTRLEASHKGQTPVGILGVSITWGNGL